MSGLAVIGLMSCFIDNRLAGKNERLQNDKMTYLASTGTLNSTRMWAIAQRDGRPDQYMWRPLFNAAKYG